MASQTFSTTTGIALYLSVSNLEEPPSSPAGSCGQELSRGPFDRLLVLENWSSDEEWCVSATGQDYENPLKCWECGKKFSDLTGLMSHYKTHNSQASCHICQITFRRLTTLSTHLDNAHSPPVCKKCHQSFCSVWELNKHAETQCSGSVSLQDNSSLFATFKYKKSKKAAKKAAAQERRNAARSKSVLELRPGQRIETQLDTPENSVEYIVGEDDKDVDVESDCEKADDSTSSETDDESKTSSKPKGLGQEESNSSSTDCSSDSSNTAQPKTPPEILPRANNSMCAVCGRGPFRSIKLHLLHCSGVKIKYECFLCKKIYPSESDLTEHIMPLYTCDVCCQVFSHQNSYLCHPCPKINKSPLVLFCSEAMPKTCNICKCFFTSEKTLLAHVTQVHMSVVSTKVCIITNPSAATDKKATPAVQSRQVQSAISSPNIANQAVNGKLRTGQTYAGSLSTIEKSSTSSVSASPHPDTPVPVCLVEAATAAKSGKGAALGQPAKQPSSHLSAPFCVAPGTPNTTPNTTAPDPPQTPTILAMFENGSHDVALTKRMNTGWRSKAPYPCRQCGAILRQPSLIISHRYLHRGRRSHRCQCGRAFKHRLHLLRHCVQHAEATKYICASCGSTFKGAKLLAQHMKGKSVKKFHSGRTWKISVKRKCRTPFTCDCGQLFLRPSAYIWHQLKNRTKSKQVKKPMK